MAFGCVLEPLPPNIYRIQRLTFDLDAGGTVVTLGRVNCDLVVKDENHKVVAPLSRHHASFFWRDNCAYVRDNDSQNKTHYAVRDFVSSAQCGVWCLMPGNLSRSVCV